MDGWMIPSAVRSDTEPSQGQVESKKVSMQRSRAKFGQTKTTTAAKFKRRSKVHASCGNATAH